MNVHYFPNAPRTSDDELDLPYIIYIGLKGAQKLLYTQIHSRFIKEFHQDSFHSSHKIVYTCSARSSEVLRNSLPKKWDQLDVDF